VTIAAHGAEIASVRDASGHEWMWPAVHPWMRSAPVLFPVIGASAGGAVRWRSERFEMPMHGFAPEAEFALVRDEPGACAFVLAASADTRRHYPFDFELRVSFELAGATLRQSIEVHNPAADALPVQVGLHPGFRVPGSGPSIVLFERAEAEQVRRLRGGYVAERAATPIDGWVLRIEPDTFDGGGFLIERVNSTWVWHGRAQQRGVRIAFAGFQQLALWSKLSADFLCVEPWMGMPDQPEGQGSLADRAGIVFVAGGSTLTRDCLFTFGEKAPIDNTSHIV
jgi:galactose mutarotase-like enzyme